MESPSICKAFLRNVFVFLNDLSAQSGPSLARKCAIATERGAWDLLSPSAFHVLVEPQSTHPRPDDGVGSPTPSPSSLLSLPLPPSAPPLKVSTQCSAKQACVVYCLQGSPQGHDLKVLLFGQASLRCLLYVGQSCRACPEGFHSVFGQAGLCFLLYV